LLTDISGAASFSDSEWVAEAAHGFGSSLVSSGQRCFLRSEPPTLASDGPLRSGLTIVADAEIHNRKELAARLDCSEISVSSDAGLILRAYEKWGHDCGEYLLGEFAFAIWDSRREQLFCCRDHMGMRPLFYWTNGSGLAFSTHPLSLVGIPRIGRVLNRLSVARFSIPFVGSRDETLYQGIMSLRAATSLIFNRSGLRMKTYWEPMARPELVPTKEQDAFEALRELLFEAVECRLPRKSGVAAFLSGGLDSSALVSVAARILERTNRQLLAVAAVLPETSKPQFADEREFIDEFRTWPNVTIEYVSPESGGPFDGIEDSSRFEEAPAIYSRQYLSDAAERAAARGGAGILLDGINGELGPTNWGQGYYLEMAANLNWYGLAKELRSLRKVRPISPLRMLGREFLNYLAPSRHREPSMLLAPDFLLNMAQGPSDHTFHWPDHQRDHADAIRRRMARHALRRRVQIGRVPFGRPFLDKRVLEFCLATSGRMKVRGGYQRYLVRRALNGVLPAKIQWRTTKAPFAPDYIKRYRAQLGQAREFVAAIRPGDPVRSVVDVHRLQYLIENPDSPAALSGAIAPIPRTVYLICFLRQFAEFRS
jgi:asparagine synthase (glutamine-hydrolysing)